jgi:hypothetical protein
MPDYVLNISKQGETDTVRLLVRVGKQNSWMALKSPRWFTSASGTWFRRASSSPRGGSDSFIELIDASSSKAVMRLREFPYSPGTKFSAFLVTQWGPFITSGDSIDVEVEAGPPPYRPFRIREVSGAAISAVVVQKESVTFEINDPKTQETAVYWYSGFGLSIGFPKTPPVLPSVSAPGDWNDFMAPSWWTVKDFEGDACLQADSVGMGTKKSYNIFQFRGHVDNYPGYEVVIRGFKTGNTYALPSAGETAGSMELARQRPPVSPR